MRNHQAPTRHEDVLSEINAGDVAPLRRLVARLEQEPEITADLARFRDGLGLGLSDEPYRDGLLPAGFQLNPAAAKTFVRILSTHPAFAEDRRLGFGLDILGLSSPDPAIAAVRREAAELLITGALAFGALGMSETMIEPLMQVSLGSEAFSRVLRGALLGRPIPYPDTWPVVPDWLRDFGGSGRPFACVVGIQNALTDFMLAVRGTGSTSYADGITGLTPSSGCAGQTVTIKGSGFGNSQPPDVSVLFPHSSGKCVRAAVLSLDGDVAWSDTQIRVVVPDGVGTGCVGFAQTSPGAGEFASASAVLAGELESCLGLAASAVAQRLRAAGPIGIVSCPPCLPGGVNRFTGGDPTIAEFTANGAGTDIITVEPDTWIVLSWRVLGATTVDVSPVAGPVNFLPLTGPVPHTGSHAAGFFAGSRPATQTYRLVATNACGSASRTVTVHLQKTPKLLVKGFEVVQVIQRADNTVRLVSRKKTLVRVFVESGLTGGFDYGVGPNIMPKVSGRLTAFPKSLGFGLDAGAPLGTVDARPAGQIDRNTAAHTLNFVLPLAACTGEVRLDVRVTADGHKQDIGTGFVASGSTTVTFNDRPTQIIEPILIADAVNNIAAPSRDQYNRALEQARAMFPLGTPGFALAPWLTESTGSWRDLNTAGGWSSLVAMLQILPFVHGEGIRTGVVPRGYAIGGMALPRGGVAMPAFAAQVGVPGTFAHEMGHTLRLLHAPCCTNFWDLLDGRLPGRTEDVGFDMRLVGPPGSLLPARALIPAGSGELMSYCGDSSRCGDGPRWPSIATWDILYDAFPI